MKYGHIGAQGGGWRRALMDWLDEWPWVVVAVAAGLVIAWELTKEYA